MSDSWRITTLLNDQSSVVQPIIGSVGATVIRAPKGYSKPTFFTPGQEQRIINFFGTPSSTYPDIWEAIQYNQEFPLWVSAPSADSLHGGVVVRPSGTKAFVGGIASAENVTFSNFPQTEEFGTGDGSTATFLLTVSAFADYVGGSIEVIVDGAPENIAVSGTATETLTGDNGTGTFDTSNGALSYTFNTAPAEDAFIQVFYQLDFSDAYFVLFDKSPSADQFGVIVTHDGTNFSVDAYRKDGVNYDQITGYPKEASIVVGAKNGFGQNIFLDELFASNDFIGGVANTGATFTSFVDDTTQVDFAGGYRGTTSATELAEGWAYFQKTRTYQADVFFDPTADPSIPNVFNTLRNTHQKYSHYILPLPNEDSTAALATKNGYSISNRGISFYWNWARVRDVYNNSSLWTTLAGAVAKKHARMYDVYNGLAPSWIDDAGGHGGQISAGVLEMAYDPSETELQTLDRGSVNPIVLDPVYGSMIVSQRTSLTALSDYSYIGHSRTADYLIRNIIEQVLPFQITKLNDQAHRNRARIKGEAIITPLAAAPYNLLREFRVICDETNNTDEVLNARQFVYEVRIKFTPFSETIRFLFTNVDQTVSVDEA